MAERRVTRTGKDSQGDITKLCNPGTAWSPRNKSGAISDIKANRHRYYVNTDGDEVDIHIAGSPPNEYLRTDPDKTKTNNLDNLPDC